MALEPEALMLRRAVRAKLLDPDKGTAALYLYSQLRQKGAAFSFGEFLVDQGLLSSMALSALEQDVQSVRPVSELGDYKLIEVIGEGHNGVVFKAFQISLERMVALKILNAQVAGDAGTLERFRTEARATARLTHPNIVMGIDVGVDQGLHYFAMELVDGGSVRSLIGTCRSGVPENTALHITRQVADGLRAAHAAGMLHRDVKPDNILMTKDGQAKLADLGISQVMMRERGRNEFWASPPYAAPEVILGTAENDPRSDLYSLGATLFEMLAQRPPYAGSTPQETLDMHLHAPVPDIQQYRQGLCAQTVSLVSSLLAKNPDERPADAAVVSKLIAMIFAQNKVALAAMIAGGGPKAAPAVPAPLPRAAAPKPVPRGLPRRGARPGPRGRR